MIYDVLIALAPCFALVVLSLFTLAAIWKVRDRINNFKLSHKDGLEIKFE